MYQQKKLRSRASGLLWMGGGISLLFLILGYLNTPVVPDEKARLASQVAFEVKQPPKPEPKKQVERKPPPRKASNTPPPPLLDFGGDLAGIDLGMPGFEMNQMGAVESGLLGDTSNVVMTSEMVDQPPRATVATQPEYPARAKAKEIEGYVVLSLLINAQGRVETIKVIESSPSGTFDDAAVRAVKGWQFKPAKYEGKSVETWANQTIRFDLG